MLKIRSQFGTIHKVPRCLPKATASESARQTKSLVHFVHHQAGQRAKLCVKLHCGAP